MLTAEELYLGLENKALTNQIESFTYHYELHPLESQKKL